MRIFKYRAFRKFAAHYHKRNETKIFRGQELLKVAANVSELGMAR